jgi:hypothetical protein
MASESLRWAADKLLEHLSSLDKSMAGETVRLYEIMAVADAEDVKYIEERFQKLFQERTQRMQEVMASKAAKDVTNRKMNDAKWLLPINFKPEVRRELLLITPLEHRRYDPLDDCTCGHEHRHHGADSEKLDGGACRKCGCEAFELK